MKVTSAMIDKELRFRGELLRLFLKIDSVKKIEYIRFLIEKFYKRKVPKGKKITKKEIYIPRRDGEKLRLCIYSPIDLDLDKPVTGLLWLHGGGYAFGIPEIEFPTIERFIQTSKTVVVSPDYRLSLDAPFPAALYDVYDSLLWMKNNCKQLGIKDNQLFVGGESAGGGLTCSVSAYARDKGEVNIAYQIPLYPMLDFEMCSKSMLDNDAPVWNEKANKIAWDLYLADQLESHSVSGYVSPFLLNDYNGLPPTYSFVGDIEPFYDEVFRYIEELKNAGVNAQLDIYKGAFHFFDRLVPKSKLARQAVSNLMENYKNATNELYAEQEK